MTHSHDVAGEGLLPCPFCGTTELRLIAVFRPIHEGELQRRVAHDHGATGYDCSVAGPVRDTEVQAIAAWNTRPTPPDQQPTSGGGGDAGMGPVEAMARRIAKFHHGGEDEEWPGRVSGGMPLWWSYTDLAAALTASPAPVTPARSEAEMKAAVTALQAVADAASFLIDRIGELEWDEWEVFQRDWDGHVDPPLVRLKWTLNALLPEAQSQEAGA